MYSTQFQGFSGMKPKPMLHPLLFLSVWFIQCAVCEDQNQGWTSITYETETMLQTPLEQGGLFVQAVQIKTSADFTETINLQVTFNGTYRPQQDDSKNTVVFDKDPNNQDIISHQLQIKLSSSDTFQFKMMPDGCFDDWTNFNNSCNVDDSDNRVWTIRKKYGRTDENLLITCNDNLMAQITFDRYSLKKCNSWRRAAQSFTFKRGDNIRNSSSFFKLPPGCLTFPTTWSDKNVQLQTETFFPIPYEQAFQLQCDETQEKYRLFVGDKNIACGARGEFEYNTEPECVLADLRDWRSDIGKEILVPITLPLEPVQIKTTDALDSNGKLLSIRLFEDIPSKTIEVKFSDPMQYRIPACGSDWINFQCDPESAESNIRIWKITKEDKTPLLSCNDNSVFNLADIINDLSDDVQTQSQCMAQWRVTGDQESLWFNPETSVSYSVRADVTTWRNVPDSESAENRDENLMLDKYPLQFKTNAQLGSDSELALQFKSSKSDNTHDFVLIIRFKSEAEYSIRSCDLEYKFDITPCYDVNEDGNEITWSVERHINNETVFVYCNGLKIIDYKAITSETRNDECPYEWKMTSAKLVSWLGDDSATVAYRFMPKSCETIPDDWRGVTSPSELPVSDGTVLKLSCDQANQVVDVTRVVSCNPRYPSGYQYQAKPVCVNADGEASFKSNSPVFVHETGGVKELTCTYFGKETPDAVSWYKGSVDAANMIGTDRIITGNFDEDTHKQKSVLRIEDISIDDSDDYICKWERTVVAAVSKSISFTVRTLQMAQNTHYSTNGTINLSCTYQGKSQGTVQWYHKSDEITKSGRVEISGGDFENDEQVFTLQITGVTPENRGNYKCVWSGDDGDKIEAEAEVIVRRGEIVSDLTTSDKPYKYVEEDILELTCQLDGDMIPDAAVPVEWEFGGLKIIFDDQKKNMTTSTEDKDYGKRYVSNIRLEGSDNVKSGDYICMFSFADKQNVTTSATVVKITVNKNTPGPLLLNYNEQKNVSIGCTLNGDLQLVGASVKTALISRGGETLETKSGITEIVHNITDVSNKNDGVYNCNFTLSDGAEFSAPQQLLARKATMQLLLASSPVTEVVSGFDPNLKCSIDGGAESIKWFKNDNELEATGYTVVTDEKVDGSQTLTQQMVISIKNLINDGEDTIENIFKCQGRKSVTGTSDTFNFDSSESSLKVFPAKTLKAPTNGHAYKGHEHELLCEFPDSDVPTNYTAIWKLNNEAVTTGNGYTISTERTTSDNRNIIRSRFQIEEVDLEIDGKVSKCNITWENGVVIASNDAELTVRSITTPPVAISLAAGANATLSCSATGDIAADISFVEEGTDNPLTGEKSTSNDTDGKGRVITIATFKPDFQTNKNVICAVKWDDDGTVLQSDPVLVTVVSVDIDSPDTTDGWVTQGSTLQIRCLSDVLETNGNVFPDADFHWKMLLDSSSASSDWIDVEGNSVIGYEIKQPKVQDEKRISTLKIGPINIQKNIQFKCEVSYHNDESKNFYGGKVLSEGFTIKTEHIQSFTLNTEGTIVKGGKFNLSCAAYAKPKSSVTFSLTNDGTSLDTKYTTIEESKSGGDDMENPHYVKNYTIQTSAIALKGDNFVCTVQFENAIKRTESLTVTTYHDCKKAPISSVRPLPNMTIEYTDEEGDRVTRIVCPDDTEDVRFVPDVDGGYAESSTCSKSTGFYKPAQLATCKEIHPFTDGEYEQIWKLENANFEVCSQGSPQKFQPSKMNNILEEEDSEWCGTHAVVPCLINKKCSLDSTKTGCRWQSGSKTLTIHYKVNLNEKVWTEKERDTLVKLTSDKKIRFWDCETESETKTKEGRFFKNSAYDPKSGAFVYTESEESTNYTGLYVGIVIGVLLLIGTVLIVYYRKIVLRKFKVFTGSVDNVIANTELDDIGDHVYDIQRSSSTTPIVVE